MFLSYDPPAGTKCPDEIHCANPIIHVGLCRGNGNIRSGPNTADDDNMIAASIISYVSAFNDRDAKAIAEHWSPEGVYTNPVTDEDIAGQEAIGKEFEELFEQIGDAKIDVSVESVQFISPNVALKQGNAKVLSADNPPREITYNIVHVKRDGKWLMIRMEDPNS